MYFCHVALFRSLILQYTEYKRERNVKKKKRGSSWNSIALGRIQEEKVKFIFYPSLENTQDSKFYHMRKVIRSNKSLTTRWSYTPKSRAKGQELLLIDDQEMQFMNAKIKKQMLQVRNIIKFYLTSIASIWIFWIIWLLNIQETFQDTETNRTIFNSILQSRKPIDLSKLPEVILSINN